MKTRKEKLFLELEEMEYGWDGKEIMQDLFNYFSADELEGFVEFVRDEKNN